MPEKLTILDIFSQKNGFIVKIFSDDFFEKWDIKWDIKSTQGYLNAINNKNKEILSRIERINTNQEVPNINILQENGNSLYDLVFPQKYSDLRKRISQIESPLLICTNVHNICWELIYDGNKFFADRYAISRYFRRIEGDPRIPIQKEGERCLIIAGPIEESKKSKKPEIDSQNIKFSLEKNNKDNEDTGDSEATQKNTVSLGKSTKDTSVPQQDSNKIKSEFLFIKETCKRNGINCEYIGGCQATKGLVLDKISSQDYRIIHYYGHIQKDEKGSYLELYKEVRLYANEIYCANINSKEKKGGDKFVFLNGCISADTIKKKPARDNQLTSQKPNQNDPSQSIKSMAKAFLASGAKVVVGTITDVPVNGARILANNFYKRIFAGDMVADALKYARSTVKRKKYKATWAPYIVFGDPRITLFPKGRWLIFWEWLEKRLKYTILAFFIGYIIIALILFLFWPKIEIDGDFDDWDNILIKKYSDSRGDSININGDINQIRVINDNNYIYFYMSMCGVYDYRNIFYHIFLGDPNSEGYIPDRNSDLAYLYLIENCSNAVPILYIFNDPNWSPLQISHPDFAYSERPNNKIEIKLDLSDIDRIDVTNMFFIAHTSDMTSEGEARNLDYAPDTWRRESYVYKYKNIFSMIFFNALIIALVLLISFLLIYFISFFIKFLYKKFFNQTVHY